MKRARIDYQLVRDATTRSEFLLGKQLPYIVLGCLTSSCCARCRSLSLASRIREFPDADPGGAAVCHHRHWSGAADLNLYEEPNRRYFRYRDYYADPGNPVFRNDRSGGLAGRSRALDWANLPDQPLPDYRPRTFSKALNISDLWGSFIPLLIAVPLVLGLSVLLLKKQEG